jgi:hypothetical protein
VRVWTPSPAPPEFASRLRVFELIARPQAWKRQRLVDLGYGIPSYLRLVPVDFEAGIRGGNDWRLGGVRFPKPVVVASTGVSMYLTRCQHGDTAPDRRSPQAPRLPCRSAPNRNGGPEVRPGMERAGGRIASQRHALHQLLTPAEMLMLAQ